MRYWEIDSLRGIAIVMMIAYHIFYDLRFFGNSPFNPNSGILLVLGRLSALLFIFLVGVCLAISYSRVENKPEKEIIKKYLARGLKIFSCGLAITLITWLFLRDGFIIFGVLHFIGLSIILAYPFLKFKRLNLFLGIIVFAVGLLLYNQTFNFPWLLWLGFQPADLYTFDYFPVFPWFGIVLIGLFFGGTFYSKNRRKIKLPDFSGLFLARIFSFLGRNSLLIYLIHQPVLIGLLYLLVL